MRFAKRVGCFILICLIAVTSVEIWGPAPAAQALVLRRGQKSAAVGRMKKDLRAKGYLSKKNTSQTYDAQTQKAVTRFQKKHGLKADGIAGAGTLKKLWGSKYTGYKKKYSAKKETASKSAPKKLKTLKPGSRGTSVKTLQKRLKEHGYFTGSANGKYGSGTKKAVVSFQKANGIKADGIARDATRKKLAAGGVKAVPKVKVNEKAASKSKPTLATNIMLKKGDNSVQVKLMQKRLAKLGYYKAKPGRKFDANTRKAVVSFQQIHGLSTDGIAGPTTLARMTAANAKKYSKSAAKKAKQAAPKPETSKSKISGSKPAKKANTSKAAKVIAEAQRHLGKRYVFASSGPATFDCSGLMLYIYGKVGISLPHSAKLQGYNYGTKVARKDLQKGDMVFFNTISGDGDLCDHVGVYIGDGRFIHAGSGKPNNFVKINSLSDSYYNSRFSWGRRVL